MTMFYLASRKKHIIYSLNKKASYKYLCQPTKRQIVEAFLMARNKFARRNRQSDESLINFNDAKEHYKKKINLIPKNITQEDLICALNDDTQHIVFAVGPAGTGKTMLATMAAIKHLEEGKIDKIIISRPNVAIDDNPIGHLPGDIIGKMAPWMTPILDIFKEVYSVKQVEQMVKNEVIEMVPIAFMRGRTFKNCWVIIDEAQGTKRGDTLKAIMTRIGTNSKMIITGDLRQSDFGSNNGLSDFMERFNHKSKMISMIEFEHRDIERHPVVKEVLKIYGED